MFTGHIPLAGSKEVSFFNPSGVWWLPAFLGLWQHNYSLCLCLHVAFFPLCVCLFVSVQISFFLKGQQSLDSGAP